MSETIALPVDADVSHESIKYAIELYHEHFKEHPSVLLVDPGDFYLAERIVQVGLQDPLTMNPINVIKDRTLELAGWCLVGVSGRVRSYGHAP